MLIWCLKLGGGAGIKIVWGLEFQGPKHAQVGV